MGRYKRVNPFHSTRRKLRGNARMKRIMKWRKRLSLPYNQMPRELFDYRYPRTRIVYTRGYRYYYSPPGEYRHRMRSGDYENIAYDIEE